MPITTMQVEMNASVWRKDGDEGSGYQTYGVHGAARKKKRMLPMKSKAHHRNVRRRWKDPVKQLRVSH